MLCLYTQTNAYIQSKTCNNYRISSDMFRRLLCHSQGEVFVYAQTYCHNFVITYVCILQHAVSPATLYDSSPLPASISNFRFLFKYKN